MLHITLLYALSLITTSPPIHALDAPPLKDAFAGSFLVGSSLSSKLFPPDEAEQQQTLAWIARHFNCVTAENAMKWVSIQRQPGVFDFTTADALMDFAQQHNLAVFGHTLVWHIQTPAWAAADAAGKPLSREQALHHMRTHMTAVLEHYRGKILAWDVVNEAITDDDKAAHPLRDTPWRRAIGDDYVELAFRMAHEIDPNLKLIYNDYGWPRAAKRKRMVAFLRELLQRGTPIHAVGIQGHWRLNHPNSEQLRQLLTDAASLGLPLHITELDMDVLIGPPESDPYKEGLPPEVAAAQAQRYREWFSVFLEFDDQIERVSFWGAHDGRSWLNNHPVKGRTNHALLLDRELKLKPAFEAVRSVGVERSPSAKPLAR